MILHKTHFAKVHDLEKLVRLLPHGVLADWSTREQRELTSYAAMIRYPGDYEPITIGEARKAVRIARRVRREIRKHLPPLVLRRPKKR